jgi:hypothetical protein
LKKKKKEEEDEEEEVRCSPNWVIPNPTLKNKKIKNSNSRFHNLSP